MAKVLNKGDIIIYNRHYYEIINNYMCYEVINYAMNKKMAIGCDDTNIIRITKEKQLFLKKYFKFAEMYNDVVQQLNKKIKIAFNYTFLNLINIDEIENDLSIIKKCHLTFNQLNKIGNALKKWGWNDIEFHNIIINPYNFIRNEFQIITFDKAEKIENEYKLNIEFKEKLNAWFTDFIRIKNSFYIEKTYFDNIFTKYCSKNNKKSSKYLKFMDTILIDKLIGGKIYKTAEYFVNYEKNVTDTLLDLYYEVNYDINLEDIIKEIDNFENKQKEIRKDNNYKLEVAQVNAVINSIANKINIITGFPGTGKSEIVKCILYVNNALFKKSMNKDFWDDDEEEKEYLIDPKEICIIAPTGLAFLNISKNIPKYDYSDKISGTCHRIVYNVFENIKNEIKGKSKDKCSRYKDNKDKEKIKYIIIDEFSMVDIYLFKDILNVCSFFNSKLLIIGDNNQLQSIGPGVVLKSLINSKIYNVTELTEIKRQNIGALVTNIKQMNYDIITKDDFYDSSIQLIEIDNFIVNNSINKGFIMKFIKENNLSKDNSKFISYFHSEKFIFNTVDLNNIIQKIYNKNEEIPSSNKYHKFTFKVGDEILRTENDYTSEIMRANGDQAVILDFNNDEVTIKYKGTNDKPEKINVDDLYESFTMAYCITVHKSQGSQYNTVVIFIDKNQTIWDKTALYTAISRAQCRCFIITNPKDFIKIQMNNNRVNDKISILLNESDNYDL